MDLHLLRAVGPALKGDRPHPDPGRALCVAEGSGAATEACRTATSLHDREIGWAGGGRHE